MFIVPGTWYVINNDTCFRYRIIVIIKEQTEFKVVGSKPSRGMDKCPPLLGAVLWNHSSDVNSELEQSTVTIPQKVGRLILTLCVDAQDT